MGKQFHVDFYNIESSNLHSGMDVEANSEEEARSLASQSFEAEHGINPSVYRAAVTELPETIDQAVEKEVSTETAVVETPVVETPVVETPAVSPDLIVKEAE